MPLAPAADDARSRLLAAAVAAFAAKGFHGTTTRDIAAAAGMSPAALYVHHRSKEELLHLISRAGHDATLALSEAAVASSDDPVEQLGRLVEDFVRHHAISHTSARVVNYELAALSEEHLAEIMALRHRIDEVVRALMERGVASGAFTTPDPLMSAAAVLSLGIDVARWYDDAGGWSPDAVAAHYRELALRMVGAG
ncbi:TetR family transcriptional regulator [Nocardioides sp. KIGAM211]|uniref:TetR family transcriptional regulator n=1 Tax=Nocardioides luti TaxID=2761101 RepID=A0A7X0VBH0_9ACTN|nr:TetR family transcriptional regulator [Nocardioides luti]MBB6628769.1 TetR family transcriptional regulator [Nocardioides luti]